MPEKNPPPGTEKFRVDKVSTMQGDGHQTDRIRRHTEPSEDSVNRPLLPAEDVAVQTPLIHTGGISVSHGSVPSYVRQYSVKSGKHDFGVTNYGPESVDKSPKTRHNSEPQRHHTQLSRKGTKKLDFVVDIPDFANDMKDGHPKSIIELDEPSGDTFPPKEVDYNDNSMPQCRSIGKQPSTKHERGVVEFAKRGRLFANRKKDRLVDKNGECNIVYSKVSNRHQRFLFDFFTTMLELKWRYHFLVFSLAFIVSWFFFGLLWWGLAALDYHIRYLDIDNDNISDHTPCIVGVEGFTTALLFSIETQHTIGYGTRAITPTCPTGVCILMFQSMFGVILQCILTGIIFAKMARPKRRAQTILFSEKAVICQRDGERLLMFRIGDIRKSQILDAKIQVMLAERKVTKEGEYLPIMTKDLPVTTDSGSEFIFLAWPVDVMHRIDQSSPFWDVSAQDLIKKEWEIIVVLEGVAEVTGAAFQVRTSYLPSEILWGERLNVLLSKSTGGVYSIDYTDFHKTVPQDITESSAKFLEDNPDMV